MKKCAAAALTAGANIICIVILAAPVLIINRYATPQVRGFDPSTPANALPYKPDTVPVIQAASVSLSTALVPMIVLELLIKYWFCCPSDKGEKCTFTKCCQESWTVWVAVGRLFAAFFAGYWLTGAITDICKYMVARPRPSFLHMCIPDYTKTPWPPCIECGNADQPGTFWPMCPECPYIPANLTDIVCQQTDWWIARNMWLSFPSGHSSYTCYAGAFLAMYLFKRMAMFKVVIFNVVALRPLIVFSSLAFSLYVALSRVMDDRHHVGDVIGGSAVGIVIGVFCSYFVAFPSIRNLPNYLQFNKECSANPDEEIENGDKTNNGKTPTPCEKEHVVISEQATPF